MKIKLVILLIVISSSFSYSQIISSIGIKSGVSLSNQYWECGWISYFENYNISAGYYEAVTVDLFNKKYWEIMTDVGFYQSKSTTSYNHYVYPVYWEYPELFNFKFSFFTFSPSFKFKIPIKSFTPYIFIGPRIDLFSSKYSNNTHIDTYPDYIWTDTEFSDQITKKPIYGFNVGEGVSYRIKRFSILVEYKFMHSFTYIIDNIIPMNTFLGNVKAKTNTHIISIGLKYNFTKN